MDKSECVAAARDLFKLLKQTKKLLVVAESCSGGLIASTLVSLSGISAWFCGSAVVYRDNTKHNWLGVSNDDLQNPQITAVSTQVARSMAHEVLSRTPEANLAISTTGYLGPESPPGCDGLIYVGLSFREPGGIDTVVERHILSSPSPQNPQDERARRVRQTEAAVVAMTSAIRFLDSRPV